MEIENKIKEVLERIRPFLISDGGNLQYIKFENGFVHLKLLGACSNCPHADVTISDGIEAMLVDEIPEVRGIIKVD